MSSEARVPASKTVFDIRINGTSEASVAFQCPFGSPPKRAAVCRLFMKPRKMPRSMCTTRRAGVVLGEPPQEPRAPRVRRLHLERAIELDGVPDDLVGDERVVVGVGDDDDLALGGGQGRRGGQLGRFPGEGQGELTERRKADQRLLDTVE